MSKNKNLTVQGVHARVEQLAQDFQENLRLFKEEFIKEKSLLKLSYQHPAMNFCSNDYSLNQLKSEVNHLKKETDNTANKINKLEMEHNLNYIIVHGISETEDNICDSLLSIFNNNLKISVVKKDLNQYF